MNNRKSLFLFLLSLGLSIGISSCGDSNNSSSTDPATTGSYSYSGPGSKWEMSRTNTTYTIEMEDGSDGIEVTASSETLSTGHIKLTITDASATGSATAPNNGDIAHAVEVPGAAFLLKPMEANAETIAMVVSGSCPTEDFVANWVIGKRPNGQKSVTEDSQDWYGSINYDVSASSATFPAYSSLELPSNATSGGASNFNACSNGKVEWTQNCSGGSTDNEIYFTQSGLMIVATCKGDTSDESHIIGIPQAEIANVSDIYGDYAGFAFLENSDDTSAFSATIAADSGNDSKITFSVLSGNDLDTVDSTHVVTFDHTTNLNSPADGFIRGTFTSSCTPGSDNEADGTCDVACTVAQDMGDNDKNMLYCIGQDPSDEDKRVTMLLVEK
jgi:hypothetical protein